MSLKTILRRHAPTLYDALRVVVGRHFEVWPPRVVYAYDNLHTTLKQQFDFDNGVFFEVGANDGVDGSNTAYLERYRGWKGILVEAVPTLYMKCLEARPRARVYHAALVPADFDEKFIEIHYANQMSLTRLSDIAVDKHLEHATPWLKYDNAAAIGQTFLAPTRTAQSVIDDAGLPEIDLFSLDVEGAELSVLKGIDFTRTRPRAFLIESFDVAEIDAFMRSVGYVQVAKVSHRDYLYRPA